MNDKYEAILFCSGQFKLPLSLRFQELSPRLKYYIAIICTILSKRISQKYLNDKPTELCKPTLRQNTVEKLEVWKLDLDY